MLTRSLWTAVGAVVVAITLASAAVAANQSAAGASAVAPDLSSRTAIDAYLKTLGVDPSAVIRQQSLLNYAGPNCPGLGWNCTVSTQVLQIALPGGTNVVECGDPALVGLDPATLFGTVPSAPYSQPSSGVCLGIQIQPPAPLAVGDAARAPGGSSNHMRCHERIHQRTDPFVAAHKCRIVQSNVKGPNHASVHMTIDQNATGTVQTAQQEAEVIQSNVNGDNHSVATMIVKQTINEQAVAPVVTHSQQAWQSLCVWQGGPVTPPEEGCPEDESSSSGDHYSQIHQQQDQNAKAQGAASSSQEQNTEPLPVEDCDNEEDAVPQPNLCANLDQHSSDGLEKSHIAFHLKQDMRTDSTVGSQSQGMNGGGLDGDVTQLSEGVKQHHATLRETQTEVAGASTVEQTQIDPSECCATQEPPNEGDSVNIDQTSTQRAVVSEVITSEASASAINPDAFQEALLRGHFVTGGDGLIKHVVSQNEGGTTQTCPPEGFDPDPYPFGIPTCDLETFCVNGECPPPSEVVSVDARGDRVRSSRS